MSGTNNTSQDPEYIGPTGFEKKFHKTHFPAPEKKFRSTRDGDYVWVSIGAGRYKRIPKTQTQEKHFVVGEEPED